MELRNFYRVDQLRKGCIIVAHFAETWEEVVLGPPQGNSHGKGRTMDHTKDGANNAHVGIPRAKTGFSNTSQLATVRIIKVHALTLCHIEVKVFQLEKQVNTMAPTSSKDGQSIRRTRRFCQHRRQGSVGRLNRDWVLLVVVEKGVVQLDVPLKGIRERTRSWRLCLLL